MKKILSFAVAVCLIISIVPQLGYALNTENDVIYFENGSYLIVSVQTVESRIAGTKSSSKTYQYCLPDGTLEWQAVLRGSFVYTGSSGNCTSATCNVTIYNPDWYEVSKTTGTANGTASAELVMGYKVIGITTKTVPVSMSITCDKDGNLT